MRKILIAVLLVLLIVLAYFTIFQGISIGSFNILSTRKIIELNNDLDSKIEEANTKIKVSLKERQESVKQEVEKLTKSKENYYKRANTSTETQIEKANTEEIYDVEYLFLRVGGHARSEGVNINMQITSANSADSALSNISFTVIGQYFGIMNFISALEDDSELSFRIESFKEVPDSGNNLRATFNVNGIRVTQEQTSTDVNTAQNSTTNTVTNPTTNEVETPLMDGVVNAVTQ